MLKDGGPAFPCPDDYHTDGTPSYGPKNLEGMSLRDWFAGMALQGILSCFDAEDKEKSVPEGIAINAYLLADAMLKERENGSR